MLSTRGSPERTHPEVTPPTAALKGVHWGSKAHSEAPSHRGQLESGFTAEGLECPNPVLLTAQRNKDHCSGIQKRYNSYIKYYLCLNLNMQIKEWSDTQ